MPPPRVQSVEYHDLASRSSIDSFASVSDWEQAGLVLPSSRSHRSFWRKLCGSTPTPWQPQRARPRRFASPRWSSIRQLFRIALSFLIVLISCTALFFPSYTRLPPHYRSVVEQATQSDQHGRGNPRNERIFIAAILYDPEGTIAGGRWGESLLQLIDLVGEDNVFLSIYENDSGGQGEQALRHLEDRVACNKSIQSDLHLDLSTFSRVTVPGGAQRIKRTDYLAELRNRALRPLDDPAAQPYDRILYLNDVIFDPIDAVQLLFSTNAAHAPDGVARYRAACAVDFINPFKFYDTYATRDLEGYGIGLQFYPWFSTAGHARSRQDVLAQKDAVRVRSCWGGMVAFNATYFQRHDHPVRFRADSDLFYDGSECCIIHADLQDSPAAAAARVDDLTDSGVYMNPYVRTAYTERSFRWLRTTRRFERLYSLVHGIVSRLAGFPRFNPRRTEIAGEVVRERMWVPDARHSNGGSYQTVERVADNDGFCGDGFGGRRGLQLIRENRQAGEDGWEEVPVPVA
ncbi:glycosyltransferase family 69 protein [Aspergillus brunneoviolaceus CBS 621.78]|uniref:Uncharacterized protein n=1 Tax=Aspergillus brunneoviolaceus CBS 621.78 TaxID=1450534 RepID=A0ACD1G2F6_9EURO|nr:hypothetical protein BO95DRAFT_445057 [Aspergillus brunneoviolaceus CBS 621.78]RAH43452.1 hypothetical protein BO95DRAFT_445057 [Aspergillus brunneoviolaceus CBS 621.78]